ncbi:MAG TPA: hypothetical protein VHO06_05795 [Polyangia bacterium]|nr:hypothetical protein [Polyangia bacterium]
MSVSDDVPLGSAGRMFGLSVREPEFEEGEEVRREFRANRWQHRIRAVGGRLYLTDRRLIFVPHKFDSKLGGRRWSARLQDLEGSSPGGGPRTIRVEVHDGRDQRFVIPDRTETAAVIDEAIQDARVE